MADNEFVAVINDTAPENNGRSYSLNISGSNYNQFLGKKIGDVVDGIFVGPADLSLRLGLTPGAPTLSEAMQQVADAAARQGKAWGTAGGGVEEWKQYRQMGAQLLIGAGDFALRDVLEEAKENMNAALGD